MASSPPAVRSQDRAKIGATTGKMPATIWVQMRILRLMFRVAGRGQIANLQARIPRRKW